MSEEAREAVRRVEAEANGQPPEDWTERADEARGLAVVPDPDDESRQVDALELARRKLRLPALWRVVKRAKRDALYDLELEDGTLIPLGPVSHVRDPRKVEDAIGEALDDLPPYYGPKEFRPVARALLALAELEDGGAAPENLTRAWIESHVGEQLRGPLHVDGLSAEEAAVETPYPFEGSDGRTYLSLSAFERHVRHGPRVPTTARDLAARLARIGFENVQLEGPSRDEGRRGRRRRYWRSPPRFEWRDDS